MNATYRGHDVYIADWRDGYKASCPTIPGCVFRSRSLDVAIRLVKECVDAVVEREKLGRSWWTVEMAS